MLITNIKIRVTEQMMFDEGLSKMLITNKLGIPNLDKSEVVWKDALDLTDEDFDKIEEYFLTKEKNA